MVISISSPRSEQQDSVEISVVMMNLIVQHSTFVNGRQNIPAALHANNTGNFWVLA